MTEPTLLRLAQATGRLYGRFEKRLFSPEALDGASTIPSAKAATGNLSGNEMKFTPWALFKNAFSIFLAAMTVACQEGFPLKDSDHQEEATMRNEIVAYAKTVKNTQQIDVAHIVEKYIKVGDSLETAKAVLLRNGFSFSEREDRKDVKVTYRIHAGYELGGSWWYHWAIVIFLCDGPESEKVDSVRAKVNLKTL